MKMLPVVNAPVSANMSQASPPPTLVRARGPRELSLLELMSLSDWYRFVPETACILLLIVLVQTWLPTAAAGGSMPHPFWIPVLLVSGQYGIMGGLFATVAASGAYFLTGMPQQSPMQDFYAWAGVVAAQPSAWLATTLVLGGLRTLHIHHQTDLQSRLIQSEMIAEDLAGGLERAVGEIGRLEQRLASDSRTVASLMRGLSRLDVTSRDALLASVADVIQSAVGTTSFAVYLDGPHGFAPCLGVQDGSRIAPTAIPPLDPLLCHAVEHAGAETCLAASQSCPDGVSCWAPVYVAPTERPVIVIVCLRLEASQTRSVASRRLDELSQVLAALLPACSQTSLVGGAREPA